VRALLVFVVVLAVLAATGCGDKGEAQESIDVGYAFGADVGDVGDRLAFRELERRSGIRARFRDMGGTSEAVVGLTRDDVELAQIPYRQLLDAIASGAPVDAVLGSNMAAELVLVGGRGVSNAADLRGKRIAAAFPRGGGDILIGKVLEAAGLTRGDAHIVYIDESPSRAAALSAGRIDAAILDYVELEVLRGRDAGDFTLLDRAVDRFPRIPQLVWVVKKEWAEDHDGELRDIVAGLIAGYERVYTPTGRATWLSEAKRLYLKGKEARAAAPAYAFYRAARFWPTRGARVTAEQHDEAVREWVADDEIEQAVSYENTWDPSYWAELAGG
jgi:ABC-type nitrate/sulfonate/bicarbonate transport system substrate-binding protein